MGAGRKPKGPISLQKTHRTGFEHFLEVAFLRAPAVKERVPRSLFGVFAKRRGTGKRCPEETGA
eukprot:366467-Chlamydomonas_euryale.AAC.13